MLNKRKTFPKNKLRTR